MIHQYRNRYDGLIATGAPASSKLNKGTPKISWLNKVKVNVIYFHFWNVTISSI